MSDTGSMLQFVDKVLTVAPVVTSMAELASLRKEPDTPFFNVRAKPADILRDVRGTELPQRLSYCTVRNQIYETTFLVQSVLKWRLLVFDFGVYAMSVPDIA